MSPDATIVAEEGLYVLAWTVLENRQDEKRRFRCVRGLAHNAQRIAWEREGKRDGEDETGDSSPEGPEDAPG